MQVCIWAFEAKLVFHYTWKQGTKEPSFSAGLKTLSPWADSQCSFAVNWFCWTYLSVVGWSHTLWHLVLWVDRLCVRWMWIKMVCLQLRDERGNSRQSRASQHSPSDHSGCWPSRMDTSYSGWPAASQHKVSSTGWFIQVCHLPLLLCFCVCFLFQFLKL